MIRLLSGKAMPLRLLLSGIAAALLLAATVGLGLYLGMETRDRFQRIADDWQNYNAQADQRGELLNRIRTHLGYGGVIHNFKNYVLRQDQIYLDRVIVQFADFAKTAREYLQSAASPEELKHLATVVATIDEYESKLPIAIRAARENWTPIETDKLVKVDDTEAFKALASLDAYWRDKRHQSTNAIASSVAEGKNLVTTGLRFLAGLFVVALTLYALFYILQRELRQTVGMLSNELAERKLAEHAAKKFLRAVDQSPATIIITDTNNVIEYVNRKFCELTGYDPREVIGRTPRLLRSGETPPDSYRDLRRRITVGEEWRGIFRNLKKDGASYWVRSAIFPLRDESDRITHYIGIGEDITEEQKARQQIERAQKMEAVGLLASGVAHDFNNLLTTILGNVHLARLDADGTKSINEELEHIEIAAKRARNLVGQVLTFARRQPGEPVPLRLAEVIEEVCQLIRASIQSNIELDCAVEDQSLSVLTDPTRLHQVLVNLCSNAAEAIGTEGGRIIVRAEQVAGIGKKDPRIRLTVTDTGQGIPQEQLSRIFEPFFTTKPVGKGTGLGLPIVANLVADMNGQISVSSTHGKGTTFEIFLPQVRAVQTAIAPEQKTIGGREFILLVDDEPEVVVTCRKLLTSLGYDVEAHTDPRKAVEVFKADPQRFDLVMTDFVMPDMNGAQVSMAVRDSRADCPIIVCTGYQPGTLDQEALAPLKVIEKPVDPVLLSHTVRNMLDREK